LKAKGIDVDMSNAGVSGEPLPAAATGSTWSIRTPEAVILKLGANDALPRTSIPSSPAPR